MKSEAVCWRECTGLLKLTGAASFQRHVKERTLLPYKIPDEVYRTPYRRDGRNYACYRQ